MSRFDALLDASGSLLTDMLVTTLTLEHELQKVDVEVRCVRRLADVSPVSKSFCDSRVSLQDALVRVADN